MLAGLRGVFVHGLSAVELSGSGAGCCPSQGSSARLHVYEQPPTDIVSIQPYFQGCITSGCLMPPKCVVCVALIEIFMLLYISKIPSCMPFVVWGFFSPLFLLESNVKLNIGWL